MQVAQRPETAGALWFMAGGSEFSKFKEKPDAVLMLNSACNAKCRYCYIPYNGKRTPQDALEATRILMQQGFRVLFSGSENLLDLRYLECYKEAEQDYILSNGIIPARQPEVLRRLKASGISEVTLSYNFGEPGRSIPDYVVRQAMRNSLRAGLSVRLSTLITSRNYLRLPEYCAEARLLGASRIRFYRYMEVGNANLGESLMIDAGQEARFFELMERTRPRYPREELEIKLAVGFSPRPGSRSERLARENRFCPAGETLFAITPDNNVYGCPFTIGEGLEIGRLTPDGLEIYRDISNGMRSTCLALEGININSGKHPNQ